MGRLLKEAHYRPEDHAMHLAHRAEHAQLIGDQHTLDYLAENFGVKPFDWDKLAERIKKIDPHGIRSMLLTRMVKADKDTDEYNRLKMLHDRYLEFSPEQRKSERIADDFWCMAVHKMSIFDYKFKVQYQNLVNVLNNYLKLRINKF